MKEYLLEGNKNTTISKLIFKARGMTLEIKTHKKWLFEDNICVGCGTNIETESEILSCEGLQEDQNFGEPVSYSMFFGDSVNNMIKVAKHLQKRLKVRQKMLDVM